jgi:hypothetical protein
MNRAPTSIAGREPPPAHRDAAGRAGHLLLTSRRLTIEGAGPGVTIIDGGGDTTLTWNHAANSYLAGLTLTGGEGSTGGGLDILHFEGLVEDVEITGNLCDSSFSCLGVGLYASYSDFELRDVWIHDNLAIPETSITGIVSGSGVGAYLSLSNVVMTDVVIEGNRIQNDGAAEWTTVSGVGLYGTSAFLEVDGLDVIGNVGDSTGSIDDGDGFGAGVYLSGGALAGRRIRVIGNELWTTYLGYGAGVYIGAYGVLEATELVIAGNVVRSSERNTHGAALLQGAAIHATSSPTVRVTNASVTGNALLGGSLLPDWASGAAFVLGSNALVQMRNVDVSHNTLDADTFESGGAIYYDLLPLVETWDYCNPYGNSSPEYGGFADDPVGTSGTISVPAGYVNTSSVDPADWDLSLAAGSGLIDAGDPTLTDAAGTRSDIGAYGVSGW